MRSQMICHWNLLVLANLFSGVLATSNSEIGKKCDTCREIVKKFKEGLIKTAKSNFGGGNTQWEEKNLGSYAFSETRFLEITEKVCSKEGKEERKCHHMLEANEELLEEWWFKHYAKGVDTDLREYLCVKKMAVCCPSGTYGPDCKDCLGGRKRPCRGNGRCEGDGTRDGSGTCTCNVGYQDALCDECIDGFYEETKNETHTICTACHPSCKLTCSEGGPDGCDECRDGWHMTDDKGCVDLDECEDVSMCGTNEFCTNTDGSYKCTACNAACTKCSGPGSGDCTECALRHFRSNEVCLSCHEACESSCKDQTPATCDKCVSGWKHAESGACEDVDECVSGEGKCDSDEYCVNTIGSFKCSTCHPSCRTCKGPGLDGCTECRTGYQRNEGGHCVDMDECSLQGSCFGDHRSCVNTPGSFRCECESGYVEQAGKCELPAKNAQKSKTKADTSQQSSSKTQKANKPPKMPPKKKSKRDTERMMVPRADSVLYACSLITFSVVCAMLKQSLVAQSVVFGSFWGYLYWLTSQMEQYIIKSSS